MRSSLARSRDARDLRPMMRLASFSALLLLGTSPVLAQRATNAAGVGAAVREWRTRNEPAVLRELSSFLAIPNLATDSVSIRRNADTLVAMLRSEEHTSELQSPCK